MAGTGARAGRRLRRQAKLGTLVRFVSETETGELLFCGHECPRMELSPQAHGKIMRHCNKCPFTMPMSNKFPTISLLLKLFDSGNYPEARLSQALLAHTHFRLRKLGLPIEE